jgi:hypothetical protein
VVYTFFNPQTIIMHFLRTNGIIKCDNLN